jgi:hypothetical protein
MDLKMTVIALVVAGPVGNAAAERELVEAPMSMDQLPQSVARTLQNALHGRAAEEIEEIRYEGLPVLYEAEYRADGREIEIAIWPGGELVPDRPDEPDDDGDDNGDDGDDPEGDDEDDNGDSIGERDVTSDRLPAPAAEALRKLLAGREASEIEEISYEGLVVLYEVEVPGGIGDDDDNAGEKGGARSEELFLYPDGAIAAAEDGLIERQVSMDELPAGAAAGLRALLGDRAAEEIEEIRYAGIPVLYEAEVGAEGQVSEFAVLPSGEAAARGEADDDDDDDDDGADGPEKRQVKSADAPPDVAAGLRRHLRGDVPAEITVVRIEGVIVLYEARSGGRTVVLYPGGRLAEQRHDRAAAAKGPGTTGHDDDDDDEDETDDDADDADD